MLSYSELDTQLWWCKLEGSSELHLTPSPHPCTIPHGYRHTDSWSIDTIGFRTNIYSESQATNSTRDKSIKKLFVHSSIHSAISTAWPLTGPQTQSKALSLQRWAAGGRPELTDVCVHQSWHQDTTSNCGDYVKKNKAKLKSLGTTGGVLRWFWNERQPSHRIPQGLGFCFLTCCL